MVDNGYDVADYRTINPIYGDLAGLKRLIKEASKRNIAIMLDMVFNHSSDKHEWFLKAKADRASVYHDYYLWSEKGDDILSTFGGSAWTWNEKTKEYYFHWFAKEQPDLNWNNPRVRHEMSDVLNYWLKIGVKGFRFDVIEMLGKQIDKHVFANGPKLHQYIKEMRANSWNDDEIITVGECWTTKVDQGGLYSNPLNREFSMIFSFEHIHINSHPEFDRFKVYPNQFLKMKTILGKWQTELHNNGWNSLYLSNHDLPRCVSKYGNDDKYWLESAKAISATIHFLQGTPFIFQGEELGMTNLKITSLGQCLDVEVKTKYEELVLDKKSLSANEFLEAVALNGRDNARSPMQWDDGKNAGFSEHEPWMWINPNYKKINVKSQSENSESVLNWYKRLIALRKAGKYSEIIINGDFTPLLIDDERVFAYRRSYLGKSITIFANWSNDKVELSGKKDFVGELVLNNYPDLIDNVLQPWQVVCIFKN